MVKIDSDLKDLIPPFMTAKMADAENMQAALKNSDFETIRKISHKTKGTAGMYGFQYLSDICAGLEEAARRKDASAI